MPLVVSSCPDSLGFICLWDFCLYPNRHLSQQTFGKNTGVSNSTNDYILFRCSSSADPAIVNSGWPAWLTCSCNRTEQLLKILLTFVSSLIWQVKITAVKRLFPLWCSQLWKMTFRKFNSNISVHTLLPIVFRGTISLVESGFNGNCSQLCLWVIQSNWDTVWEDTFSWIFTFKCLLFFFYQWAEIYILWS